jgi:hypothetical protein
VPNLVESVKLDKEESRALITETVASATGCFAVESINFPLMLPSARWAKTGCEQKAVTSKNKRDILIAVQMVRKDRRKTNGVLAE